VLSDDLIARLRRRADDPATSIDMTRFSTVSRQAPATDRQLAAAEDALHFPIPAPLRQLYQAVANGGFGPGYGLLGLGGGATDDRGATAEQVYRDFSTPDPDDPAWAWRDRVLPFCYWGCVVYSCLTPAGDVIGFDEGTWDDRAIALHEWLERWLDGNLTQPGT
jgi:hypothetical protein